MTADRETIRAAGLEPPDGIVADNTATATNEKLPAALAYAEKLD